MNIPLPTKQPIKDLLTFVFIPLLLGVFIYYFTRPHSIYFLSWTNNFIPTEAVNKITLPYWVVYHLPDGLWAFAFTSVFLIIWERKINVKNIFWLLTPLTISIMLEFNYGTFDLIDLYFIIIGGSLPLLYNIVIQFFNFYKL
jgi:hypothetical protein